VPAKRQSTTTSRPGRHGSSNLRSAEGRFFALAVPGLGSLAAAELESIPGVQVRDSGFDGRSDVVLFVAEPAAMGHLLGLRLAEDVFVEVGRTLRSAGDQAQWIAGRVWPPERAARALTTRARLVRPLRHKAAFRVITRVLQERSFLRTDLRRHVAQVVQRYQPQWRFGDPADVEAWVVEYQPGRFISGLRLSDAGMRQHDGRAAERGGALRPTVAAAMVRLAGAPGDALLDPCCGSGTILAEALAVGWSSLGVDIDPGAVEIARHNVPKARLDQGDVRDLEFKDGSVEACVSNLPFGRQYEVQGEMEDWLRAALREMVRVTRPGGRVVLLAPTIPRTALPRQLHLTGQVPIRLLGTKTTIWAYDRR
jgi:23S rRNA G2445 N2-methylase RlmL